MKIKELKINAYGNLNNKEIELSDNINIVYGKNEAGKSTLLKFITNMFYGTSKNKKGREFSDYDRFKPWGKEEFSGKIKYELDNGSEYEVYREFGKKSPKIYNSNMEDISKDFSIDKTMGNQFFYDQTKVDESTFLSTIASMQQEVKLEKNSQNNLIQKMANIAGSGEDNVSYKKAMEKLYKKQLDEIGTDRSQSKPINNVQNKIKELENKKNNLLSFKDKKYDYDESKNSINEKIQEDELKIFLLKKLKSINEQEALEEQKLNYNLDQINEKNDEIKSIEIEKKELLKRHNFVAETELIRSIEGYERKLEKIRNAEDAPNAMITSPRSKMKKCFNKYAIIMSICVFLIILVLVFAKNNYLKIASLITIPAVLFFYFIEKNKIKENDIVTKNKNEINKRVEENKLLIALDKNKKLLNDVEHKNAQIQLLEKGRKYEIDELERLQNKINTLKEIEIEKLKNSYRNQMDIYEINRLFNSQDVNGLLDKLQAEANEKRLEIHRIDLNKENIIPQLENLAKIEEELEFAHYEYDNLIKKNNAIIIAKNALEKAYEKMRNTVTPKFTQNLSKSIGEISNGKYNKISFNDENGLIVELTSGEYVPAEVLSIGTIDQLYLALRLSMCTDISEENMPLILDEAFAFYDDERLENILRFLIENYYDKQIIILTCTTREENILNKFRYEYNKICL